MTEFAWRPFLEQWSRDLLLDPEVVSSLSSEVVASGWLGYAEATDAEIAQAEAHLGTVLPPSYRSFLQVTNGWRTTTPFIYRMWSAEEIEWFSVRNQHLIDMVGRMEELQGELVIPDEEYFVYGEVQTPESYRSEYMQAALEISDWGDAAIYLLDPQVTTPDGEWEAWFMASWLPGAHRYQSFQELMQAEYEQYRALREGRSTR